MARILRNMRSMRSMKKIRDILIKSLISLGLIGIHPLLAGPVSPTPSQPVLLNQIVAIVNQSVITQRDLDLAVLQISAQAQANGMTLPSKVALEKQALKQLIFDKAALALAQQNQITVTHAEMQSAMAELASNNHMTTPQLLQTLATEGVTAKDYETTVRTQLIIRKQEQQMIAGSILITPQEITDYLSAQAAHPGPHGLYEVQHILLALPNHPTPAEIAKTKAKAELVLQKIQQGLSFSTAAIQYSDSGDALKGGDLGYETLQNLPTLFAQEIPNMKPGQVIGPLEDANGFHLLKLVAIKTQTQGTPQDLRRQAEQALFQQKAMAALETWRSQLLAQCYVDILVPDLQMAEFAHHETSLDPTAQSAS